MQKLWNSDPAGSFRLFRLDRTNPGEWIEESCDSIDHLIDHIHNEDETWSIEEWEQLVGPGELEGNERPGVMIENTVGDYLLVGLDGENWRVNAYSDREGFATSISDDWNDESLAFLFPDWTYAYRGTLIPVGKAEQVIRVWLTTGVLWSDVKWAT